MRQILRIQRRTRNEMVIIKHKPNICAAISSLSQLSKNKCSRLHIFHNFAKMELSRQTVISLYKRKQIVIN